MILVEHNCMCNYCKCNYPVLNSGLPHGIVREPANLEPPYVPPRSSLDLSEHLPYLINRVGSALVERFCADALTKAGLSIASWRVLAVLATHGVLRQTDLAELTSIEV